MHEFPTPSAPRPLMPMTDLHQQVDTFTFSENEKSRFNATRTEAMHVVNVHAYERKLHMNNISILPSHLKSLINAARRQELNFPIRLVNGYRKDFGIWVLDCAARYSTGHYSERRFRDLCEAYGQWQQIKKANRRRT